MIVRAESIVLLAAKNNRSYSQRFVTGPGTNAVLRVVISVGDGVSAARFSVGFLLFYVRLES